MKPASSLFTKILSWFFLNLLIVAAILAVFFSFQPHVNLYAIFGKEAVSRLRTAGLLIAHDLRQIPQSKWSDELARHAAIHRVDFAIVFEDGSCFSSTDGEIPMAVMAQARSVLRRKPPRHRIPPSPRHMEPPRRPPIHLDDVPQNRSSIQKAPPLAVKDGNRKFYFRIKTKHPTQYWSGIRISRPLSLDHPMRGTLLAISDSVTGRGFFFDPLPWMVVAAVVVFISALLWIPIVRNITRPLARMTRATEEIANGRFETPIHEPRSDEIGRLAKAISHMSRRLSALVKGQKRFLGDVAHELGSPIARIQFGLGALEQRIGKGNRQRVIDIMDDVEHMSHLANELLAFSRADLKADTVRLETIDLLSVVDTAVKREHTTPVDIITRIAPGTEVVASAQLLIRAFSNLVRNAVKYAGYAGPIEIFAHRESHAVVIQIRDKGPGVHADLLDQLFEPFFRPEASRGRDFGGVGLGLAIVKTCIETCQGSVSAVNLQPKGFAVTITLKAG